MRETATRPDLADYDLILVNSSAGKDSQAMLHYLYGEAERADVVDRMVVVHCDLGRAEWPGVPDLAKEQADMYGLPFEYVSRDQDLLDQIEHRGKFPSSAARYCTSDQKTAQVLKLMTRLVREANLGRQMRILNCLGIRAEESPARAKKTPFGLDRQATNGKRHVNRWLPIFDWTLTDVWTLIGVSGVPYHPAYDLGMARLSCAFCVLASERDLRIAARALPDLAAEYVALEDRIGHTFKNGRSIAAIVADANAEGPGSNVIPLTLGRTRYSQPELEGVSA